MKILVVEDDDTFRELLAEFLERYGHEVSAVGKASQAQTLIDITQGDFDILISDIFLPGSTGFNVLRYVKDNFAHITTLVMTGFPNIVNSTQAIELGAYSFIPKPLKLVDMISLLRRIEKMREREGTLTGVKT
ncbi:MAG TPA: response regulator [bacterium]|nr:response regulator [bacterium]